MRGRLITIEGGEGVGKSSFIKLLSHELGQKGIDIDCTREPGGTKIADLMRNVFSKAVEGEVFTVEGEFLLVSAARAQHVSQRIIPHLNKGKWVVCDRFADSSRVYQGFLRGLDAPFMEFVIEKSTYGIKPDITFLLDCEASISQSRVKSRQIEESRYDSAGIEIHETLRKGFLQLRTRFPDRIHLLDAALPLEENVQIALKLIWERFHD